MKEKSTYELEQLSKELQRQYVERERNIRILKGQIVEARLDSTITAMDYLRLAVATLGGEQHIDFLEVYRHYIKAHTRLPHNASVFPFLNPLDDRNQMFSNTLPRIMLACPYVKGIKIMPSQSRGSYIILETGDTPHVPSADSGRDERQTTDS
ncbi:hypothetical protein EalM132_00133 [Exiguobacterium phage vB_EalM-132]|nr:hypothetical protein EalM132_00133 [Exiguobacterium phage vB_EalM-132]